MRKNINYNKREETMDDKGENTPKKINKEKKRRRNGKNKLIVNARISRGKKERKEERKKNRTIFKNS